MDKYVLTIMVTLEQENAIQKLFGHHGWEFSKINIDVYDDDDKGDDEDDEYSCDADTEEALEDLNIFVKEVDSDNDNKTMEITVDNTSRTSSEVKKSEKGKRMAQFMVETRNRKIAKQKYHSDTPAETANYADKGDSEVRGNSKGKGDKEVKIDSQVKGDRDIEHESKVASPKTHDVETFQTGPNDIDDSGFSASLAAYFCKDCQYTFPEAKYYGLHKQAGKCVFQCQFCNERFTFKKFTEYQEHLKHHREKDGKGKDVSQKAAHFVCPICTKQVSSIYNMVRHVKNVHTQQNNIYRCPQCYLTFETKETLMTHKKIHQSICPDCGKFYSSASSLNVHMKKIRRKYHCLAENCLYVATSKQALDFHMNGHSGSKPFSCKHCGKSYQRKDSCSRHQLLCVSGITCDVCNARLGSRGALSAHHQAVHSDERFQCFCGSIFKYRTNLLRHRRTAGHVAPDQECEEETEFIAVLLQ